jgi:hypothetical protein
MIAVVWNKKAQRKVQGMAWHFWIFCASFFACLNLSKYRKFLMMKQRIDWNSTSCCEKRVGEEEGEVLRLHPNLSGQAYL